MAGRMSHLQAGSSRRHSNPADTGCSDGRELHDQCVAVRTELGLLLYVEEDLAAFDPCHADRMHEDVVGWIIRDRVDPGVPPARRRSCRSRHGGPGCGELSRGYLVMDDAEDHGERAAALPYQTNPMGSCALVSAGQG